MKTTLLHWVNSDNLLRQKYVVFNAVPINDILKTITVLDNMDSSNNNCKKKPSC